MKNIIATSKAPSAIGPYSQGVGTGSMVYTSGQIPLDPATGKLVEGGIEEQAHQALKNLGEVLKAGGADYANVVKTTVFLTDLANFKALNEIYAQYFTEAHPARSCIEISALPLGSLVEIEAVALLG